MSVKLAEDGAVVENTITQTSGSAVSDLYGSVHQRAAKVLYKIAEETGDPDAKKWADACQKLTLNGHRLGAIQAKATDYSMSTYNKFVGVGSSIPTATLSEDAQERLRSENILGKVDSEPMWDSVEDIEMPVSVDGEMLPMLVTTNETSEATHTFEEALPILKGVMDHIEGVEMDEINAEEESTSESNNDGETDSSEESINPIHDPTWIDGVGPATAQKLRSAGYEIRATEDVFQAFESDDYYDGSYDEQSLLDRLAALEDKMADEIVTVTEANIEAGLYEKAEGTIEAFEVID